MTIKYSFYVNSLPANIKFSGKIVITGANENEISGILTYMLARHFNNEEVSIKSRELTEELIEGE